jgi:hypothetical protein
MATRGSTTKLIPLRKEFWFLRNASRILLFARFLSTAPPNLREAMIPSFGWSPDSSVFINCIQKKWSLSLLPFFFTSLNSWVFRSLKSCGKHWVADFNEGGGGLIFSGTGGRLKHSSEHALYGGDCSRLYVRRLSGYVCESQIFAPGAIWRDCR